MKKAFPCQRFAGTINSRQAEFCIILIQNEKISSTVLGDESFRTSRTKILVLVFFIFLSVNKLAISFWPGKFVTPPQ